MPWSPPQGYLGGFILILALFNSTPWNRSYSSVIPPAVRSRNQTTPVLETDKTDCYETAHLQLYPPYPFPCAVQTSLGRQSGSYQACRHRQRHPS